MNNECTKCNGNPCDKKSKAFPSAVIEIDNPPVITNIRKVVIPVSMGDDTTVPPMIGKYHNVLLYYEANQKSYLYSSDGIPTQLVNGFTNYEEAINLPQINGVTLMGDKSSAELKLADAPIIINIAEDNYWSCDKTMTQIYDAFNAGTQVILDLGSSGLEGTRTWPVLQLGYNTDNHLLLVIVAYAQTYNAEEFTGDGGYRLFTLRNNHTAELGNLQWQRRISVLDYTGLRLDNSDVLFGVPATESTIGMVKPGDGLEVASDGTLSISDIEQYAHFFDTVADMKAADNLVAGDYARTGGFYAVNDGGGALYKIADTGTANEMDVIAIGNTLFAYLVLQPSMNVKQFGAKGDGTNDDTNAIQTTLNYTKNVFIPSGTYMINAITHISPNTGNKLTLDNDAILKAITNAEDHYEVIYLDNVNDVEISGGTIEGDKLTHTGATGEWGQCISIINNSSNIYIHDITITNSWGDGIYINTASGVRTQNLIINGARRNGISIVSASNYKSLNDTIINTGGTAPESGIDIEPNYATNVLKDIVINNLHTENNAGSALTVNVNSLDATQEITIKVFNHYDEGSNTGLIIYKSSTVTGEILIDKPYYINSYNQGIKLRACYYGANACHINIDSPTIIGYNVAGLNSTQNASGISGFRTTTDPEGVIGNITIKNPIIKTTHTGSSVRAIAITPAGDNGIEDVTLVDPIDFQGPTYVVGSGSNIKIYDKFKKLINTVTGNLNYVLNYIYSEFVNTKTASNHYIVTLNADIKPGVVLKFTNYSASYHFRIKIPAEQYCTQLDAGAGPRIVLNNLGNSITLKKIDATNWDVIDLNCTPTIEF